MIKKTQTETEKMMVIMWLTLLETWTTMIYSNLDVLVVPYALHIVVIFPKLMDRLDVVPMVSKIYEFH